MADGQALRFNPKPCQNPSSSLRSLKGESLVRCSAHRNCMEFLPGAITGQHDDVVPVVVARTYIKNTVPTADDDLAKMGFLNLVTLVQPTIQTNLNAIIFFDGFAGARRFRKKFATGPTHHVVWHQTIHINAAGTSRNKYLVVVSASRN